MGPYVKTTMEAINSTFLLMPVQDGVTHVSVRPVDITTTPCWIASRPNAKETAHIYTCLLQALIIDRVNASGNICD